MNTIVALGDSITYGYPYTPDMSWVRLTGAELGLTLLNKGVNGDSTAGMLARFKRDVIAHSPSHVIILGGTNDACARVAAEAVAAQVRQMAELALQYQITPLIGLPVPGNYPPDEAYLDLYRQDMRDYALACKLTVIDFYAAFKASAAWRTLYADVLHPNAAGYRVMAAAAAPVINSMLM
ncbi:GDSL-type esterase/lipase family protein [Sporomusa termitida]|uniref:GDSL-like Lipase/Acylhydrolase family protein n=1 Tax=Sporomusa termitida TaxID=2377 RepID=A0A517DWN7_9FIRM|nr:GDSL-type esterase/lipase family protein [Sporomusa termitida]QDR81768.1 GDSL-like Lipase/Acylhydrolase family protein [Sporomusa termitida]